MKSVTDNKFGLGNRKWKELTKVFTGWIEKNHYFSSHGWCFLAIASKV